MVDQMVPPLPKPPYISFLDAYPHPAFVLTLGAQPESDLIPTYTNPALSELLSDIPADGKSSNFIHNIRYSSQKYGIRRWILGQEPTFFFEFDCSAGVVPVDITKTQMDSNVWVCTTVPRIPIFTQSARKNQPGQETEWPTIHSRPPASWLKEAPISVGQLIANFDWTSTPRLGSIENWPQSLKTAFGTVMASPHPSALFWGPEVIGLYNDGYALVAGSKHPQIWGQSAITAWDEVWSILESGVRMALSGTAVASRDDLLFLERLTDAHLPEESYITWSYVPVHVEDGSVGGFINHVFDTTDKVIAQRRMNCLRDVIAATILTTSPKEFSRSVIGALSKEAYSYDVSFAALYFCTTDESCIEVSQAKDIPIAFELDGKIGIPENHSSVPNTVLIRMNLSDLKSERVSILPTRTHTQSSSLPNGIPFTPLPTIEPTSFPWPFGQVIQTCKIVHMDHLDESLISSFERRGWGDKPREAVVIPIGFADQVLPSAILVLGINTRRPYDSTYRGDIDIMRMTLSSTLHATLGREAEVKRSQQLAELDAAKTAFFSNASHELRTPLTLIGGPLEDCIAQVGDGVVKQNLKMAQRNVFRLTRLVDSLMDFSRLAAKKLEGQFRPVRLGLFTADLASLFRNPVEKGGLVYEIKCDMNPVQPKCYVDPDFWEKIVFNLVGNAFKYTLSGSIMVSVVHTPSHAILKVEDTGCGIPQEDIKKIFQRFHRVQTTSRSHEGTGIGLALTKELVSLHGGNLDVESNNDPNGSHGTTLTASIPLGKAHLPKANVTEENLGAAFQGKYARGFIEEAYLWSGKSPSTAGESEENGPDNIERVTGKGHRLDPATMFFEKDDVVLLVDDNSDMRRYVKSILSRYCNVVEASNGKEALEMALNIKPNVVLSDVMMPVMDGLDLLKELRERKETMLIPVVLVTAKSGDDSRIEGLLSGADDYLVKPFKSGELIVRVHLQMQLGKKRAEMEDKFFERTLEIQQLSELSPVAIFRADHKGRIIYVNPRWYDITGHSRNIDADRWPENIHPEDKTMVLNWWMEACEDQRDDTTPITIDFRWKNESWCQGQCVSMAGRGVLGAFTDISEHKKLEEVQLAHALEKEAVARRRAEEAEERRREAEERRRGQELLIDVTSHELRQPVSAILNCSSLVRTNLSALYDKFVSSGVLKASPPLLKAIEEDLDALDAIYQCGLAQERIANDVLSLSRMQLNVLSIIPVEFNLKKEIGRIVSLFRNETRMKKITMNICYGASLKALGVEDVCLDKARFAQVVTNLLSNAIKFTDTSHLKRDIVVQVDVSLERPTDETCKPPFTPQITPGFKVTPNTTLYIYVSVTDSGPGLAPEDLSLLFQRFQQGSNSHDVFGGSGLGLFVSRQLCSLMGGHIEVSSPPGQGATFRFFIEAMTASSAPLTPVSTLSVTKFMDPNTPHPVHVLITEDNLINQTVLNRQLTKAGCTTTLASNGQQAIEILCSTTKPIDAVLMDIEMPVMDGLSAIREIRHLEAVGKLPRRHRVYALTGNAREGQVKNIREAGMDDVIIKPYRIDELLAKLRLPFS